MNKYADKNATVFYRMTLSAEETGLVMVTNQYVSIHETPCFHFCLSEYDFRVCSRWKLEPGESLLSSVKARSHKKIYRIAKSGSRIAFSSKTLAFENLKKRKERQINHLRRDLDIAENFLSAVNGKSLDAFEEDDNLHKVPGTEELVNSYYRFD